MDSKEALEFINRLFWENAKPILNELEKDIFLGVWQGKTYADISAKTIYTEQYLREAGTKLYKRIKEDLEINVTKRNFKNPIQYRYKQQILEQDSPLQLNPDTLRMTSPPAPLLVGEGSNLNPFVPQQGRVDNLELFFNREREIRRVFEVLNSGSSVALIGEEGIGKSSLLWKICQQVESCLHSPRQSVFLDLNLVHDENDFYCALCLQTKPAYAGFNHNLLLVRVGGLGLYRREFIRQVFLPEVYYLEGVQ